ncbi:TPA: TraM recognition domain-containing protein [Neisseria meningitidis]
MNKAGGAGYQVTVYTQTWKDVEAKIGSPAKAGQIGGNLNTMIMLRVKTVETAEMLTNQLPEVKIMTSTLYTLCELSETVVRVPVVFPSRKIKVWTMRLNV